MPDTPLLQTHVEADRQVLLAELYQLLAASAAEPEEARYEVERLIELMQDTSDIPPVLIGRRRLRRTAEICREEGSPFLGAELESLATRVAEEPPDRPRSWVVAAMPADQ